MKNITILLLTTIIAIVLVFVSAHPAIAKQLDGLQEQPSTLEQMEQNLLEDKQQIIQILNKHVAGWTQGDASILKSMWDMSHQMATYLPAKSPTIIGPENIAAYYDESVGTFPVTTWQLNEPVIDIIGEFAQVDCTSAIGLKNADGSESVLSPRLSFTLMRKGNEWLVIHYHESIQYKFE